MSQSDKIKRKEPTKIPRSSTVCDFGIFTTMNQFSHIKPDRDNFTITMSQNTSTKSNASSTKSNASQERDNSRESYLPPITFNTSMVPTPKNNNSLSDKKLSNLFKRL